ncbi:hypothetical protein F4V58_07685 [Corynebacterium phocae]|nr:hypothetical protein F4V58_07685 [Corynebacterium phocae]
MVSATGPGVKSRQLQPVPYEVPPAQPAPVALIDVHAPGRTADALDEWAQPLADESRIPAQALRAYGNAELIAKEAWPACHLRWSTLAGIGYVETRHGTYNGNWFKPSRLQEDGTPDPAIVGIALNGTNGTANIADSDGGRIDGDSTYDRAVGPMQFIPQSWQRFGSDANGDGVADPHQIDDAAMGAAALLCAGGRDLSTSEGWTAAIMSYNASDAYVRSVGMAANSYAVPQPATS